MTETDEHWMRIALEEAQRARQHADVPIGAVLVDEAGAELGRAHNRREIDRDPCAHAAVLVLRAAARDRGVWRLEGTTLYVTLEPCIMCAGALVNARVQRLVFAASDPKAGAVGSLYDIPTDTRLNHRLEVRGGVLSEEGAAPLKAFFASLRAAGQK